MHPTRIGLLASSLVGVALAQSTTVLPTRLTSAEGNSSQSIPWGLAAGMPGHHFQYFYGSANFTGAVPPINFPIVIQRLRWRADGGTTTWTGGTYNQVRIDVSTAANAYTAPSTVFANNHGQDRTTLVNGPMVVSPQPTGFGTPGPWYIDTGTGAPFLYNPADGDLLIDVDLPGGYWTGGTIGRMDLDTTATVNFASRVGSSLYGQPTGTAVQSTVGVVEVTYVAAAGLFARFTATPASGNSPHAVQFTDRSISTNPGGVLTWAWDFDNDNVVDSTLQNPLHTYTSCGSYAVRLTVTDGSGAQSLLRLDAVVVDPVSPAFSATPLAGQAPHQVQFTDASTGPVTGWSWDFENDGIVDSTVQNPLWIYNTPGTWNVRLVVTNGCAGQTLVKNGYVVALTPTVPQQAPEILQYQFNEVRGQQLANTASGGLATAFGQVFSANWQGDPGRVLFMGNEAGAGMLASGTGRYVNTLGGLTITGSMTVMWWERQATASTGNLYAFGSSSGSGPRCFGTGTLNYTGSTLGDVTGTTGHRGPLGQWRHIALVVDDALGKATWYVDGIADPSRTFAPATHSAVIAELHVGYGSSATTASSYLVAYNLDDFRIYGRGLGEGEIQAAIQLSENPSAGTFGSWCDGPGGTPQIGAIGLPSIGNLGFGLTLANAEDNKLAAMVLGLLPRAFGTFDLSGILGPGCQLEVDWISATFYVTAGGAAVQGLGIPNSTSFRGMHVYGQWLIAGTSGAATRAIDVALK